MFFFLDNNLPREAPYFLARLSLTSGTEAGPKAISCEIRRLSDLTTQSLSECDES